jgi:hypothetical protein
MAQTCTYCSSSISDGDAFCQNCGRPAAPRDSPGALGESPQPAVAAVPAGALPSWATPARTGGLPAAPPVNAPSVAAGGSADPYVGSRLTYSPVLEPSFDPLASSRFLVQVLIRAALYGLAYALGAIVLGILFLLTNFKSLTSSFSSSAAAGLGGPAPGSGINGFGDFLGFVWFLFALALIACFWFLKIPIQLSEWKLTVDGKAGAAPSVFSHVAAVMYQRQTPIAPMRVHRFRLPATGTRDYLEMRSHIFYGYVACFPYGQDLYIGWTFWSKISPIRFVFMFLARIWQSVFNHGNDLNVALRYDSARALREVIHSATRQGVDVAIGRLEAQGQGIIGSVIPMDERPGDE